MATPADAAEAPDDAPAWQTRAEDAAAPESPAPAPADPVDDSYVPTTAPSALQPVFAGPR